MKILLIFPPQWTPLSPHFAIPSLLGQLKNSGFKAKALDLNIDFYNKILTEEYITNALNTAFNEQDKLLKEISAVHSPSKQFQDYPEDIQNKMVKYSKIKEYKAKQYEVANVPKIIEEAVRIMKSKDDFYDSDSLVRSLNLIDMGLDMASLPFYPSKITFENYTNPFFKLNFESIKKHCFNKDINMYLDYYDEILPEIINEDFNYIGISINSSTQVVPGLTLANKLKNKTNAHVNIGGNFFGRVTEVLKDKKEFFDLFAHSVLVEEGEKPVIELAKHLNGDLPIEKVSNLVYLKENEEIQINDKTPPTKLDQMQNISLEGFALDKYFVPEVVLPFQTSRGCYWRKCSFCDQDFGQNFNVKNQEKLIQEIKELKEKYKITKFEFIDEAIGPSYMAEMSQRLMEENLDINYFCNARLERAFSKEILTKARESGLRMTLWGLESGSDKIMELINKGIDINQRINVLTDSREADIWNFAFIFFGFPAETKEDALKTIELLCQNKKVISSYGRSVFTMGKHTRLRENPEKYGITEICEVQDEFSPSYDFKTNIGMDKKELNEILKLCTDTCNKMYDNPLWMYLRYREILFLYICHYGADKVENQKFNSNE